MHIIQPCCAKKHVMEIRDAIGRNGMTLFEGYGDLSLTELLPAILTRYAETEMLIAAPSLPDQAAEAVATWMKRQWARADGNGKIDVVSRMTVIADFGPGASPRASGWLRDNPFGGRLTLVDVRQDDTVLLLPDFAVVGPVNMRYGGHFIATATTRPAQVADLWAMFRALADRQDAKDSEKTEEAGQAPGQETPAEEAPAEDAKAADEAVPGRQAAQRKSRRR